jgi:hypothetical protein
VKFYIGVRTCGMVFAFCNGGDGLIFNLSGSHRCHLLSLQIVQFWFCFVLRLSTRYVLDALDRNVALAYGEVRCLHILFCEL